MARGAPKCLRQHPSNYHPFLSASTMPSLISTNVISAQTGVAAGAVNGSSEGLLLPSLGPLQNLISFCHQLCSSVASVIRVFYHYIRSMNGRFKSSVLVVAPQCLQDTWIFSPRRSRGFLYPDNNGKGEVEEC